jgi:hypothetical protein
MNTSLIFVVEDDSWYADLLEYMGGLPNTWAKVIT